MPPPITPSPELQYLLLVVGLFIVARTLQRFRLPSAVTAVALGVAVRVGLDWFHGDSTIELLGTLGIVSMFLFAGLEVDFAELARGQGVQLQRYRDGGLLVIEGSTAPEQLMQVLALTMMELYRLDSSERPIDEEELWTARMQIRGQHLLAAENTHTRMSRLATQHFYFDRQVAETEVLQEIAAIDLEGIQNYVDRTFVPSLGDVSVAVVGPDAAECFNESSIRELMADFQGISV